MKKLLYTALFTIVSLSSWYIICMESKDSAVKLEDASFELLLAYTNNEPEKFDSYLEQLIHDKSAAKAINIPVYNDDSATLLHCVLAQTHSNQASIIQKLIVHGANYNARDSCGDTPLMSGAKAGNYHAMRILLETVQHNLYVTALNNKGRSVLNILCDKQNPFGPAYDIILMIIEHNQFLPEPENMAIPNTLLLPFTMKCMEPLQISAKKILRKLLVKNFHIPRHPELIQTIFGTAAYNAYSDAGKSKNTDTLNAALKRLENIFTRQIAQETLTVHENSTLQRKIFDLEWNLFIACKGPSEKTIIQTVISYLEQLEKLGVKKLTLKDPLGNTALHWAASLGNTQLIAPLLHYSTDAQEKNASGKTAYDLAKGFNHKETMKELEHPKQWVVPAGIAAGNAAMHPLKEDSGPDGFDDNNGAATRFSEQPTQKDSIEPRADTKESSTKLWRSLKKPLIGTITLVTTAYVAYSFYSQHQKNLLDRSTGLKQTLLLCLERGDTDQAYELIEAQQEAWQMLPESDRQYIQNKLTLYLR